VVTAKKKTFFPRMHYSVRDIPYTGLFVLPDDQSPDRDEQQQQPARPRIPRNASSSAVVATLPSVESTEQQDASPATDDPVAREKRVRFADAPQRLPARTPRGNAAARYSEMVQQLEAMHERMSPGQRVDRSAEGASLYPLALLDRIILQAAARNEAVAAAVRRHSGGDLRLYTISEAERCKLLAAPPAPSSGAETYATAFTDDFLRSKRGSLVGDTIYLLGLTEAVDGRVGPLLRAADTNLEKRSRARLEAHGDLLLGLLELAAHALARADPGLRDEVCVSADTVHRFTGPALRSVAEQLTAGTNVPKEWFSQADHRVLQKYCASRPGPRVLPHYDTTQTAKYLLQVAQWPAQPRQPP